MIWLALVANWLLLMAPLTVWFFASVRAGSGNREFVNFEGIWVLGARRSDAEEVALRQSNLHSLLVEVEL